MTGLLPRHARQIRLWQVGRGKAPRSQFHGIFATPGLRGRRGAIHPLIEERQGVQVAEVEQDLSARRMPGPAARALGLGRKDRAVRVMRRYRDDQRALILDPVSHHLPRPGAGQVMRQVRPARRGLPHVRPPMIPLAARSLISAGANPACARTVPVSAPSAGAGRAAGR